MLSNADMIAILQSVYGRFVQLLRVDESAVGAAFITDGILAVLVENGRMTARCQLILLEQDVAIGRAANAHLEFVQHVVV